MSEVIFARPDYEYDSYKDVHRLIWLSGFPLVHFNQIDPHSDNTYIMTLVNGENNAGWPGATARIILFDLEWRLDNPPAIPGVSEVWASDAWYAKQIGAKYVLMGSHPDLPVDKLEPRDKLWDVAPMSYFTHRRETMVNRLREKGVQVAMNGWDKDRHGILERTRAMLHVHQLDNAPTVAPQRFALAAAYKMPLISEAVADYGLFAGSSVLWCDYDHLDNFVAQWKNDPGLPELGEQLHQFLCVEHPFRKCVEAAL